MSLDALFLGSLYIPIFRCRYSSNAFCFISSQLAKRVLEAMNVSHATSGMFAKSSTVLTLKPHFASRSSNDVKFVYLAIKPGGKSSVNETSCSPLRLSMFFCSLSRFRCNSSNPSILINLLRRSLVSVTPHLACKK
jgi:hypothetical protein